jgi:hypothetical protein
MRSAPGSTICPPVGGWPVTASPPPAFVPLLTSSGCYGSSGRLACCPTLALSLCCFSCFYSLRVQHWEFGSLPHSHSPGQVQYFTPPFTVGVRLLFSVYAFQFCSLGDWLCPGAALDYVPRVGELEELHMVCDAHLFILQIHTSSFELASGENWCRFSQCSTA